MKLIHTLILSAALIAAAAVSAWAVTVDKRPNEAANLTRACVPADGHTTQLSISGTSAGVSSALSADTVFSLICTTAVYWETGDTAAPTADSNADYLPADTLIYFATSKQSLWVSAVQVASSGTCYIHECE